MSAAVECSVTISVRGPSAGSVRDIDVVGRGRGPRAATKTAEYQEPRIVSLLYSAAFVSARANGATSMQNSVPPCQSQRSGTRIF
ncbi:MAG: hypothetical protein EHM55_15930 [Acidobacteria bacterium]|nr:MAG: hypothetical protein EHM55_15930 [Acidobacteriota bacterium]